jgi:hypothetical protein
MLLVFVSAGNWKVVWIPNGCSRLKLHSRQQVNQRHEKPTLKRINWKVVWNLNCCSRLKILSRQQVNQRHEKPTLKRINWKVVWNLNDCSRLNRLSRHQVNQRHEKSTQEGNQLIVTQIVLSHLYEYTICYFSQLGGNFSCQSKSRYLRSKKIWMTKILYRYIY